MVSKTVAITTRSFSCEVGSLIDTLLVMVPALRRPKCKVRFLLLIVTFPSSEVVGVFIHMCDGCSITWHAYRLWTFLVLELLVVIYLPSTAWERATTGFDFFSFYFYWNCDFNKMNNTLLKKYKRNNLLCEKLLHIFTVWNFIEVNKNCIKFMFRMFW